MVSPPEPDRYMSVEEQERFPRGLEGQGQPSTEGQRISITVGRQAVAGCRDRADVDTNNKPVPVSD